MPDPTDAVTSEKEPARGSTRVNVSVPAELLERARELHPDFNASGLFQDALRALVSCEHTDLVCARCGTSMREAAIADRALTRFYVDVISMVHDHARAEGTVIGLSRRLRDLARSYQLRIATELPLPGLTRAEREAAKVKDFPAPKKPAPAAALAAVPTSSVEAG